jgi:hypothetical protein
MAAEAPVEHALATIEENHNRSLAYVDDAVRTFEGIWKLAEVMAKVGTLPAHLKTPQECFRVVVQAAKWRMDPFMVAECTSVVHGRLCYEGKLVAAMLASMNAIRGRLKYQVNGTGQDASIIVTGTQINSDTPMSITGNVRDWRTVTFKKDRDGKATDQKVPNNWDKDPISMLHYRGTRQWARLYAPEAMAGIYTNDEMEDAREVEAEIHREDGTKEPAAKVGKTRRAPIEGAHEKDPVPTTPTATAPPVKEQSLADAVATAIKSAPAAKPVDLPLDNLKADPKPTPKQEPAPTANPGTQLPTATIEECEAAVTAAWRGGWKKVITQALSEWSLNEVGELAGAPGSDRHDFIQKLNAMVANAAKAKGTA